MQVLDELAPALAGARVRKVLSPRADRIAVVLRAGRERVSVLFVARAGAARVHALSASPVASGELEPFTASVRSALIGARLRALRVGVDRRLVELAFESPGAARDSGAGAEELVHLALDLSGPIPALVLLDVNRRVLASLTPGRRRGRGVEAGSTYDRALPEQTAPVALGIETAASFPQSLAIETAYARIEAELDLAERRRSLERELTREVRRRRHTLAKIDEDEARARAGLRAGELGELLKGSWAGLRRGMAVIELADWFSPGAPIVPIELDPALSPHENVERYFHRARKARRGLPVLAERRARIARELEDIELALLAAEAATDPSSLDEAEDVLRRLGRRSIRRERGPSREGRLGPRRFISRDGFEILVGRNARQNDELTLRIARGNDLFLHVAGRPGSHVIVRSVRGREVPESTLVEAAQLALYYSLVQRSSGALESGVRAEVDWTQAKHVAKPKGAKPGAVLLRTHKTLRVELDGETIRGLRERTEEPSAD